VKNQDFDAYADFKRFNTNVANTWDSALTEALISLKKSASAVTFLDYGCGDGKYFSHLVEKKGLDSKNVHGVEVASSRVIRCQNIGWFNARLIQPNGRLPYEDNSFDIINMMEVIEHIPSEQGRSTLRELRRVLRNSGVLLISTPNYPIKRFYDFSDAVFHGKWERLRDDPTHVTRLNEKKLRFILEELFNQVDPYPFKPGFLYKRFQHPYLLHKLFYFCKA
jgi:SAM-dependent methyltransferase